MRILLVDDDEVDRLTIRRYLTQAKLRAEVDELSAGADVVARAQATLYDCIILDHSLPGESGIDIIRRLHEAGVTTPILVVAGQDEEVGAELVAAGATDFLCKEDLTASRLERRLRYVHRLAHAERAARQAAERGARARQDVLMVVSHDLRGPLSAIQVALDGLIDETSTQEERLRYAGAVTRSVQRADRLVRDLMVAAQLEAGTLRMEWSKVSSRALLEQAVRDNEMLAAGSKVKLVLGPIDDAELRVDRERLLQAVANLVQNALRHARGTPDVTLSARKQGDALEISARDKGPGISAEALPKLFDAFWQGSGSRGGAGLGLAIVRGIARAHGGDARAAKPEGGGAEFVIRLPLSS
jgi:two-component system, sensor histidine kinase and response regulator